MSVLPRPAQKRVEVTRWRAAEGLQHEHDPVVVEEPLEIRLNGENWAMTLRTPGRDQALVAGLLFSEGIVRHRDDLSFAPGGDPLLYDPDNLLAVELSAAAHARYTHFVGARRELLASAACGLCGRKHLDDLLARLPPVEPFELAPELLCRLPAALLPAQGLFHSTGGVHAAALFDEEGKLLDLQEDVGRHNALDKLVGTALLADQLPWHRRVVVTTARAGFELVQKTLMAGAPILVAVGATSTLAIEKARLHQLALYAFTRENRLNRYA